MGIPVKTYNRLITTPVLSICTGGTVPIALSRCPGCDVCSVRVAGRGKLPLAMVKVVASSVNRAGTNNESKLIETTK